MNKKTQTIIGVLAVGVIALYFFKNSKKDKVFANLTKEDPILKACKRECMGSENYNNCMFKCVDRHLNTDL